jgi:hypothetical protein
MDQKQQPRGASRAWLRWIDLSPAEMAGVGLAVLFVPLVVWIVLGFLAS